MSALMQAYVAREIGSSSSDAFLLEFIDDMQAAQARGPRVLGDLYLNLFADLSAVAMASVALAASRTGTTPVELLAGLLTDYQSDTGTN